MKRHEVKSRTRENDAIKRLSEHEMYEAAAGITQQCFTANIFLQVESVDSRITISPDGVAQWLSVDL